MKMKLSWKKNRLHVFFGGFQAFICTLVGFVIGFFGVYIIIIKFDFHSLYSFVLTYFTKVKMSSF